jgi:peptidoglycan/LPS O-acetylase OafA/YrhL
LDGPLPRYETLDGLRGVAAIAVLLFHLNAIFNAPALVTHGYLAVDFFFLLSGFVLAHGYSARLRDMTLSRFIHIRARRLLPLSVLGVTLGTVLLLSRSVTEPALSDSAAGILAAFALNLVLVPKPWLGQATEGLLFPADIVLWSLSLEMAVNIVWAAFLVRAGSAWLALIVAAAAVALVFFAMRHGGLSLGLDRGTYVAAVARASFSFFLGVLIWRFRPCPRPSRLVPWVLLAALAGALCIPVEGWIVDVICVFVVFPVILYVAVGFGNHEGAQAFPVLGRLSYPLYATHVPIALAAFASFRSMGEASGLAVYLLTGPTIAFAVVIERCYDEPVRRWLSRGPSMPVAASAAPRPPP